MPHATEKTIRLWMWAFRAPMLILIGIAAFGAKDDYLFIAAKGNEQLMRVEPYHELVKSAQLVTCIGVC